MSESLSILDFEKIVGEQVELALDGQKLKAKITEVMKMNRHGDVQRDPFSVLIVTDDKEVLEQQIFSLHHEALGQLDIFLVPLGPRAGGMCYEAVFS